MPGKKIGRNQKCPCRSGLKFKHCCGASAPAQRRIRPITFEEMQADVQTALIQQYRNEQARIRRFGHVRQPISIDHQGYKFVGVGNRLHYAKSWRTFHDFLWHYIAGVFTSEWGNAELQKPFEERHPVAQWYHHLCNFQQENMEGPGPVYSAVATGTVMAYTALAYDLYTLDHHALLQKRLVERIKKRDQFQGARYETYVAAAFIRAGFDVILEDETDISTSHCEFNATHKDVGARYSVEAKSRHWSGYLGQSGTPKPLERIEADVYRLLQGALRKRADHERIIFIDVNVPPVNRPLLETEWFKKIAHQLTRLEESQSPENPYPSAFVFFTNHPYHYVGSDQPEPGKTALFTAINMPEFREPHLEVRSRYPAIHQLADSVFNHTAIPHDFGL
jgi:hypothetical protein